MKRDVKGMKVGSKVKKDDIKRKKLKKDETWRNRKVTERTRRAKIKKYKKKK